MIGHNFITCHSICSMIWWTILKRTIGSDWKKERDLLDDDLVLMIIVFRTFGNDEIGPHEREIYYSASSPPVAFLLKFTNGF